MENKAGVAGQPEHACQLAEAGRGWPRPRLEAALSLIWRWRGVLELANWPKPLGGCFPHSAGREIVGVPRVELEVKQHGGRVGVRRDNDQISAPRPVVVGDSGGQSQARVVWDLTLDEREAVRPHGWYAAAAVDGGACGSSGEGAS